MRKDIVPGTEFEILQDSSKFSYGIDAILLSYFAKARGKTIDLGTGMGIIPIRMAGLYDVEKIYAVEIQEEVAEIARENVRRNNLEEKIEIIEDNIINLRDHFEAGEFDVLVSNPPYMKKGSATINEDMNFAISRHEIECTFEDIAEISSYLLKPLAKAYFIHRPNRLVDIFYYLRKNNMEPKRIRNIQPNVNKKANIVLIEAVKNGNPELIVERPLIVYDEDGDYTKEIYEIYGMDWKGGK